MYKGEETEVCGGCVCVCKEVNPSLAGIIFQGDEIRNMSFVK